jgi:hypothetical protein
MPQLVRHLTCPNRDVVQFVYFIANQYVVLLFERVRSAIRHMPITLHECVLCPHLGLAGADRSRTFGVICSVEYGKGSIAHHGNI